MQIHDASALLPRMSPERFCALRDSIARAGLIEPIVLWRNQIIDGRHRYEACMSLGVDPRFVSIHDDANPWTHAKDRNERRDLTDAQRYGYWKDATRHEGEWQAEQDRIQAEANKARSEKAKAGDVGRAAAKKAESPVDDLLGSVVGPTGPTTKFASTETSGARSTGPTGKPKAKGKHKGRDTAAKQSKTSTRTVKDMDALEAKRPDLRAEVMENKRSLHSAVAQMRDDDKKAELSAPVSVAFDGLHRGDFRVMSASIPDESVELVFTDPPYDRESIPLFEDAAREAARVLKPGGSFIAYCGQIQLPEVLALCSNHLRYWWVNACIHQGTKRSRMNHYGLVNQWKPMVWFVKGHRGDVQTFVDDAVSGATEKSHHEWQQAESEAAYYIEHLSSQGGVVVDFFAGGGTTLAAARSLGRQAIGFEISAKHYESAVARLAAIGNAA